MTIKIETERLIIRDFQREDSQSLARNINHPLIHSLTANIPYPYTLETAEKYMLDDEAERKKQPRINYRFAIQLKDNPDVIGSIGIHNLNIKNSKAEIGYWLSVDYHSRGIMSEAEESVLKFAFEDLKLHKIIGTALAINKSSNALFKKFGFRHVGTLKEDRSNEGIWIDTNLWELLNQDYRRK